MRIVDDGLELLDEDECLELLAQGVVGRVALSMGALPAVFPVNYVLDGRAVVFRTGPGVKLSAATDRAVIAFEVDRFDPAGRCGWSVLAIGIATEVVDPAEIRRLDGFDLLPWPGGDRQSLVRMPVEMISGRRIGDHTGGDNP